MSVLLGETLIPNELWFWKRYCDAKRIANGDWDVRGYSCNAELLELLQTCMIRRLKRDVELELPPKTIDVENVDLDDNVPAKAEYLAIREELNQAVKNLGAAPQPWQLRNVEILASKARIYTAKWKS